MNTRPVSRTGPVALAFLATAALLACLYFLHAAMDTPFPPYDIAEAIVAVTPGSIATTAIEQLGVWAQRSLKLIGLAGVLLVGTSLGAWLAVRAGRTWLRILALACAPLAATLLLQSLLPGRVALGVWQVLVLAVLFLAWSALIVLTTIQTAPRAGAFPPLEAAPLSDRRAFLLALTGGTAGLLAAAVFGADRVTARKLARAASANALPTPAAPSTPTPPVAPTAARPVAATAAMLPATSTPPAPAAQPALATPAATPTLAPGTPLPAFSPGPGTRPNITPIEDFYVVDKAVVDPDIDIQQWTLAVRGLVAKPLTLTFTDLLALPRVDVYATLECISNEVAGKLIGTTLFSGCRLAEVLKAAGPQAQGVEVVLRSQDGYSESLTVDKANDPDTLLVYGMDGKLLEQAHGYPVRLFNPNHYGMKSPKWITSLEVVAEPYDGYWVRLGWDKEAVVKTTSVIDAPGQIKLDGGAAPMGGIAFAGWRGIERVDVQIDWADFAPAVLDRPLSPLTWVRWRYDWTGAASGSHKVVVRATDGTGTEQESLKKPPHPDGASGWHTINLQL